MVGAAGHLGVGVLHLRCCPRVHGAGVGLVLGDQLPESVEGALHLVDNRGGARGGIAGDQVGVTLGVVGHVDAAYRAIDAATQRRHLVGGLSAENVVNVGVDVAVAVGFGQAFAKGVYRITLLLAARCVASARVGILHRRQNVVAVHAAAAGRGDAVDELRLLVGATDEIGLEREHVAAAVEGILGGLVGRVGDGAAVVGFDGFGRAAEIVVIVFRHYAARVGDGIHPAGGSIGRARDQHGVGTGGGGRGARVGRAAVGADVHARRLTVG